MNFRYIKNLSKNKSYRDIHVCTNNDLQSPGSAK